MLYMFANFVTIKVTRHICLLRFIKFGNVILSIDLLINICMVIHNMANFKHKKILVFRI